MFCKLLLPVLVLLSVFGAHAAPVQLDYQYQGDHGVDLGEMSRGPLAVGSFADGRPDPNAQAIEFADDRQLADWLREAFLQGFRAGGAEPRGEQEAALRLDGELTVFRLQNDGGQSEVTIRSKVSLQDLASGKERYGTTAFGRASAEEPGAAIRQALDSLANSLFWDDYFLMQLLD